jgi:uncharacterized protein
MKAIAESDIKARIARDNPWWEKAKIEIPEALGQRRVYFAPFKKLALNFQIRRATILLGPRRVGKTYMIKQIVAEAISEGISPSAILYVSIDTPIYSGISLDKFVSLAWEQPAQRSVVIFDEIQYLRDWETHLKDLVDNFPNIKFIATGSAAAALQLKSRESGAGRFSDFMLPPLTFYEFLTFLNEGEKYIAPEADAGGKSKRYSIFDIEGLNKRFVEYLNYGGYPEAVLNEEIRKNPEQFIKNDIIDKILLKDLPSLYGIHSIQELNKLFSFLAYNAGNEASFENICQESGVPKPTIKKYIEYLESAFLIIKVSTVDDNCATLKRERNFKVYLNNPSMRAALIGPVSFDDSKLIGRLAECAIFSQWQHSPRFGNLKYARWRNEGEVDIVYLAGDQKPLWIGEVKWSDRVGSNFKAETSNLSLLIKRHKSINAAVMTSRTFTQLEGQLDGIRFDIWPSAAYCYIVGRNITNNLNSPVSSIETNEQN